MQIHRKLSASYQVFRGILNKLIANLENSVELFYTVNFCCVSCANIPIYPFNSDYFTTYPEIT